MAATAQATKGNYLVVKNLVKRFGDFTALKDVNFEASKGEFLSILGPSGCGKTTLLRALAGLDVQSEGQVWIGGREVSRMPIAKRNIGIVFQSYALFPNLTAAQNIAYGLTNQRMDKANVAARVDELLNLVGLPGKGGTFPAQLSGGQQQRVALARAMALSPDMLFLDEPLSALDAKVRVHLRTEIRELQKRLGVTSIMVTHDQEEALTMADRIMVMDHGVLVQYGSPEQIYDQPATPFVASFIGSMNFVHNAEKLEHGMYLLGDTRLKVENLKEDIAPGGKALIGIRPEDVHLREKGQEAPNLLRASINSMEYRGATYRVAYDLTNADLGDDCCIESDVDTEHAKRLRLRVGSPVSIHFPPERIHVYPMSQVAGGRA